MQADDVPGPVLTWGHVPRTTTHFGTYVFYTQDYRYTALWNDPRPVVNSQCQVVAEPNFSCYQDTPLAVGLWRIYQKRWLARWWQSQGIRVLVDLNVAPEYRAHNLLGVPAGWRAYATRGYSRRLAETEAEYQHARSHAGGPILFVVYGGGRRVAQACEAHGWRHIPECMTQLREAKKWPKAVAAA